MVTPRQAALPWLNPGIVEVLDGYVCLLNSSPTSVIINKADHIADIRETTAYEIDCKTALNKLENTPDQFQFQNLAPNRDRNDSYLQQLCVDPDNILTASEKELFHQLHRQYSHVFTPQPGRYNGHWGYVENKLQFSSLPAPNARTHVPNYSPSMN